ncbi:MAG: hypothetical protein MZW92_22785 [Comamonadaceae bacterium]|nr:hypothetical protein [Comamonadaceae bacterium]
MRTLRQDGIDKVLRRRDDDRRGARGRELSAGATAARRRPAARAAQRAPPALPDPRPAGRPRRWGRMPGRRSRPHRTRERRPARAWPRQPLG